MLQFTADYLTHDPSFQWTIIVLAVATILYVSVIRPAMQKKRDPLAYKPIAGNLAKERGVERQMQNLLVELSEMARQMNAQLDTRSQKLQLLLDDADQRIAKLEKLQTQGEGVKSQPAAEAIRLNPPATARAITAPSSPAINLPVDPLDAQHQQIYALADQGQGPGDIARELNRPRGEVELILALRPSAVGG
jgi:hypothetical protein